MNADRSPRGHRDTPPRCPRVRSRINDFVDGRLTAKERGLVQGHLKSCVTCMQEARDLARLSRATHNLPPHRAGTDLADRVRRGLAERRSRALADLGTQDAAPRWAWHRAPGVRPALAAATIAAVWIAGFFAGRGVERLGVTANEPESRLPAAGGLSPRRAHAAALPPTTIEPEFVNAGHEILTDLEWATHLPQHVRRPMLASQFELFDLRHRAELALARTTTTDPRRSLAQLVHDFGNTLRDPRAIDWHAWSSAARSLRLALPAPAARSANDRGAAAAVVEAPRPGRLAESNVAAITDVMLRVGVELSPPERRDLAELLHFKQLLVHGEERHPMATHPGVMATFLSEWQSRARSSHRSGHSRAPGEHVMTTSLRFATGVHAVRTLRAAGRTTAAAEFADMVEHMARELGIEPPVEFAGWR
ncbi:MAG: zf-HC2 domain-containing protein [bacterium]|nr:zf-HC2 domain-containing protein [bacterium]